ncbi:MAG: hypothetical protein A3C90_04550 [Candidatus Magasanikbacteria bacterium RIFCSPHIGHO2_02_FULL_51_14]|uniref:Uncharacterized protein n=1 Tax=Candidatus Magasanikbacteria bacterium RIFCSPHIGHO2_02_FULL_51_14 TaxID=1798683 RepID=A0A1F6MHU0_9BACT|nr:MAG: hypothetical protein A3C90_04550 [Candidatus Magasanikbacteria bacterium RIFCSPHIGHO2_02_FULL_51_14]
MTIHQFIQKRPYLVWYTKNYDGLSEDAIVASVLQYGDFDDARQLFKIMGMKNAARIFRRQLKRKRDNYDPRIANYFSLYFKKHLNAS